MRLLVLGAVVPWGKVSPGGGADMAGVINQEGGGLVNRPIVYPLSTSLAQTLATV